MPKKKVIVSPIIEKKPKVKYVSKLKEYAINFDATIKIHQGGFESALPWCIKVDKSKYANLTKEQITEKVKEAIRLAISDKCPWVSEIISLDNVKFSQELINNEVNQRQESK
nr:MAG TPA: hypothetical protein [Crassvirales sp.]